MSDTRRVLALEADNLRLMSENTEMQARIRELEAALEEIANHEMAAFARRLAAKMRDPVREATDD